MLTIYWFILRLLPSYGVLLLNLLKSLGSYLRGCLIRWLGGEIAWGSIHQIFGYWYHSAWCGSFGGSVIIIYLRIWRVQRTSSYIVCRHFVSLVSASHTWGLVSSDFIPTFRLSFLLYIISFSVACTCIFFGYFMLLAWSSPFFQSNYYYLSKNIFFRVKYCSSP